MGKSAKSYRRPTKNQKDLKKSTKVDDSNVLSVNKKKKLDHVAAGNIEKKKKSNQLRTKTRAFMKSQKIDQVSTVEKNISATEKVNEMIDNIFKDENSTSISEKPKNNDYIRFFK
ncbi:hypothetical protein BB559_004348 [Furculomyces boomerangus]|uniref:Uncharacterized protein n=2 Tax=Harpellales TaxID=61421 RepID=A0A2T9YFC9_9FUNG|nr:hypothetical protein BB559_004348 [Furculomyces boomerangus]PWA01292.1 hypothetical protein BB558_002625 [Smittium angustum]